MPDSGIRLPFCLESFPDLESEERQGENSLSLTKIQDPISP